MEVAITSGILTSLSGRYAKVLFDLATEKEQVKEVGTSLLTLRKLIQSSQDLRQAFENPTVSNEEQEAVLKEICTRLKSPEIVQSFFGLLIKARRVSYIHKIEKIYRNLVAKSKGKQKVEVISAYPLTPYQVQLLKDKLKKASIESPDLIIVNDPKVLGGIMIRIGVQVIDATLATQLNQLAKAMKGSA